MYFLLIAPPHHVVLWFRQLIRVETRLSLICFASYRTLGKKPMPMVELCQGYNMPVTALFLADYYLARGNCQVENKGIHAQAALCLDFQGLALGRLGRGKMTGLSPWKEAFS